ncbi:GNAT family N-acetyltransferase [Sphingomonas sp.]|uniref:GNAT family N-acetyltransferase n=1 Tax=Sphingomonas sp. TaxID=28214 RepID=UPI002DD6711A|nr:GNAT family N-acetyltransferase [Sphingomonas sp.]
MFARTPRLTLRPGWIEDAAALARAIAHESVAMKLARLPWPYSLFDAETFLAMPVAPDEASCLVFAHEDGEPPRLIGGCGIHRGEHMHELGYWLTPEAWGRGYATEAGRAMLGIARWGLGHRRLAAHHHLDNPASGRVLRKLGFTPTGGVSHRASRARGGAVASASYAIALDGGGDVEPPRMAA